MRNSKNYYETPWLVLRDLDGYGADWARGKKYYVCDRVVRRDFDLPATVKRIKLCIRRGIVGGAMHASQYDPFDAFNALIRSIGRRFNDGAQISWWVEYEKDRK